MSIHVTRLFIASRSSAPGLQGISGSGLVVILILVKVVVWIKSQDNCGQYNPSQNTKDKGHEGSVGHAVAILGFATVSITGCPATGLATSLASSSTIVSGSTTPLPSASVCWRVIVADPNNSSFNSSTVVQASISVWRVLHDVRIPAR